MVTEWKVWVSMQAPQVPAATAAAHAVLAQPTCASTTTLMTPAEARPAVRPLYAACSHPRNPAVCSSANCQSSRTCAAICRVQHSSPLLPSSFCCIPVIMSSHLHVIPVATRHT
jgi:hypothetical protein